MPHASPSFPWPIRHGSSSHRPPAQLPARELLEANLRCVYPPADHSKSLRRELVGFRAYSRGLGALAQPSVAGSSAADSPAAGSVNETTAPTLSSPDDAESIQTRPPWSATSSLTTARP